MSVTPDAACWVMSWVLGALSWCAGIFENPDSWELSSALAKPGWEFVCLLWAHPPFRVGVCVSLPFAYSDHVAPMWCSWISLGWFSRAVGEEGNVGCREWGEGSWEGNVLTKFWTSSGGQCIHIDFQSLVYFRCSNASFWFQSPPSVWKERCAGIFVCCGLYVIISGSASLLQRPADGLNPAHLDECTPAVSVGRAWG